MKKLLLVSLLAMGATSFAAIEGTGSDVSMPITIKGTIIPATSKTLVIESTTGGVQGNNMTFDFGDIVLPTTGKSMTKELRGEFTVSRADKSSMVLLTDKTKLKIGFDENGATTTKETEILATNKIKGILKLNKNYVTDATNTNIIGVRGEVITTLEVDSTAGTGAFTNTSESIYVKIEA